MSRFISLVVLCLSCSLFTLADTSHASLTQVKVHHQVQHHHAHKAVKHHTPKHHHNSI